jgi:hypothetical protein
MKTFKFIFRHKLFNIAVTILADDQEEADEILLNKWNEIKDNDWDIPHYSEFNCISQTIMNYED